MLMSVTLSSRWGSGLSNNHVTFKSVHNACGTVASECPARGWAAEAGESREESLEAASVALVCFPWPSVAQLRPDSVVLWLCDKTLSLSSHTCKARELRIDLKGVLMSFWLLKLFYWCSSFPKSFSSFLNSLQKSQNICLLRECPLSFRSGQFSNQNQIEDRNMRGVVLVLTSLSNRN